MIYSITLNPSLDYVVGLPKLALGRVNRLESAHKLPGGKGINVSRILEQLGISSTALGFAGGFTGQFLKQRLTALHLQTAFTPIADDTRINVKLKAAEETELNAAGPTISPAEITAFKHTLTKALKPGDVVVMAGSLPNGLPTTFYHDLIPLIHAAHAEFVIDTTGQALLDTLPEHPYVVKPNHHELAELFGDAEYPSLAATAAAGRRLLGLGAQHVLVSMAGKGALLITPDAAYHGFVQPGSVQNSVGAGDSMLAGFTGTYQQTHDALAAFKVALACGSATAFSLDLADKAMIDQVFATITITQL
ncbi:1-phosphofructokinase [Lacticaseibacillus baoqingensis]|uniref:Tagatose-6-phosphate kinase n=1 Tax=Lacticaseibacillus baoqingensis TaxID=2486013 RepID=A0ABW4E9C3_9LACO|nr:1-phosphofructokinase [Lacticaseibacillus baoqingensis]